MPKDRIIAVGLLTQRDVTLLGPTFDRLWPVEDAPEFEDLLKAIDDAERQAAREKGASKKSS
ncbi:MAG TPA: hypothetical protein VIL42_01630 [Sphingomicrobium sp.]